MPVNAIVTPFTLAIAYLAVFVLCVLLGRGQRREGGATVGRLVAVAALVALLIVSPAIGPLLFGEKLDTSWTDTRSYVSWQPANRLDQLPEGAEPDEEKGGYWVPVDRAEELLGTGYSGWTLPMNVLVLLFALLWALRIGTHALRPVRLPFGERGELPEVGDPAILDSVRAIAERMRTRQPRVLRLASTTGSLTMQAATGGTVAPVLIATDGVLERLQATETSAILAHEIGHIARRSIWRIVVMMILILVTMVVASGFLFPIVSLALGYTLMWTSLKVHGHFDEPACDLLAARAVGFVTMAGALDKIHAANSLPCGPLVRRLFHATQTHPSAALRLQHLARHAPPEQQVALKPDEREAALQRKTNRLALGALSLVLAFAVWAGFDPDLEWYGVAALAAAVLTPAALMLLAVMRRLRFAWRIGLLRFSWRPVAGLIALVACFYVAFVGLGQPWFWPSWLALAFAVWLVWRVRRRRRLHSRIRRATRAQDFDEALRLHDRLPRHERRAPVRRYMRAWLLAADDRNDAAFAELESLADDHPEFWTGHLLRSKVIGWRDPNRALEIASHVDAAVPENPYVLAHAAACLGRVGRFEAAEAKIREAIALDPEDGSHYGVHADIAIRAGELDRGDELIKETAKRDPGATRLFVLRARLLLERRELEAAGRALQEAKDAVAGNKMSLLMHDVLELEARYHDAIGPGSTLPNTR